MSEAATEQARGRQQKYLAFQFDEGSSCREFREALSEGIFQLAGAFGFKAASIDELPRMEIVDARMEKAGDSQLGVFRFVLVVECIPAA